MGKKGQQAMGMSFGMIFAVFLIVVFIVVAFIAVSSFLDLRRSVDVGLFWDDLQKSVDDAWRGQASEASFKVSLPSEVKEICFGNLSAEITDKEAYDRIRVFRLEEANMFLVPPGSAGGMELKLINHINISKITAGKNPYCVDAGEDLKIKKGFYDKLVLIE